mmetsp:Transcript_11238/g.19938  ORF Transcript_11238/g.19938 Transcript_11238/m.19938 type:complete len:415 (+) Transcript_11238:106-1350(+)
MVAGNSRWVVVGGADKGGVLVREGQELASLMASSRLSTGAEVEELNMVGDRLHYRLVVGEGPKDGWVSTKISGKELLSRKEEKAKNVSIPAALQVRSVVGPHAGYRHRWAINIDNWRPSGDADGQEFQFLLNLIHEEDERKAVMRFRFLEDKKRALVSRLLIRQASASALKMNNFKSIQIKRTKGKKPFLAEPLPPDHEAPNWNANCSHEGSWVVCASEPKAVAGIDVAELRRTKKNGEPINFHEVFRENLTEKEWEYVKTYGPDPDREYEAFSRFWSAKEAFVKARGDGIAYPLGKAEFHWKPLEGCEDKSAFEGSVAIEGQHSNKWRFVQHRMPRSGPSDPPHWTTVGRGPLTEIVDANGEFTRTLRKHFTADEWKEVLQEESPHFDVLPVAGLVPQDHMTDYVKAGGCRFP